MQISLTMKIFSKEELDNIIRRTTESDGISSLDLIETAAESIAAEITARWLPTARTVVFAGWGNNGADALATARILAEQGYNPDVYLFNIRNQITPECRTSRDKLKACSEPYTLNEFDGSQLFTWPELDSECLVIDGIFGTGLNNPMPRPFQLLASNINNSNAKVVSIDLPSGMFCDWNNHESTENMVHATLTLALGTPHLPMLIADYTGVIGEWKVLDIGLDTTAIRESPYQFLLIQRHNVRQFLPPRNINASKADFGTALICAGSEGMMGASVLAANGALRAGAGKVVVHAPQCGLNVLQTSVPCAMAECDEHPRIITRFPTDNTRYNAIAIGPGIGTADDTIRGLEKFLKIRSADNEPVVIDADGLNCIARRPMMLDYLPVLSVLTPHAGEFDRIFGAQPNCEARLRKAIEVANFHRVIIVLKGHYTAIVRPDGKVFFNSTGTPAMATGGSGDVLTGMIVGLMAQGYKPEKATFIACYIHGLAGEFAAALQGEYSVTASDIAAQIGPAIRSIQE